MEKDKIREAFENSCKELNLRYDYSLVGDQYKDSNTHQAFCIFTMQASSLQSAQEEIERLKCCGNCKSSGPYEQDWWPCETCNRSNGMGYKDNWEAKK